MKYIARFVFYHYDEFDTTLADIYDIIVKADEPSVAFKIANKIILDILSLAINFHFYCESTPKFISLTDENGKVYILLNNKLVPLSSEEYNKLPKRFCYNGETFFTVDAQEFSLQYSAFLQKYL